MPSRTTIDRFLAERHLVMVGVSRDPKNFANGIYRQLRNDGHTLYPVNPAAAGAPIEGDQSYPSVADVPDPADGSLGGVVVMVPAAQSAEVVQAALDRGIRRIWLHRGTGSGSVSTEALALCSAAGAEVVDGACPFMFSGQPAAIHRLHRALSRRRFTD